MAIALMIGRAGTVFVDELGCVFGDKQPHRPLTAIIGGQETHNPVKLVILV